MEHKTKILIAEDDTDINTLIHTVLARQGYQTVQAFSGTEARLRLEIDTFALLILDLMLPGMSGEELLLYLRSELKSEIPVLILSARSSLSDKVSLLTGGADDYMTKPFEPEELLARVFAALRRSQKTPRPGERAPSVSFKNLCLYPEARKVTVKGRELELTPHEYDILSILLQAPDKVFSRETLYEQVWNGGYYGEDNTVNVHVSNLRKKLSAQDPDQEYIKTVWGIGFKMANL